MSRRRKSSNSKPHAFGGRGRQKRLDKKTQQKNKSVKLRTYGKKPPHCQYCGGRPILSHASDGFTRWVCEKYPDCDAKVGCHPGTTVPLGTMANKELRAARRRAHSYLYRLWEHNRLTRDIAYQELAAAMGLPVEETHIGKFDLGQCEQAAAFARLRLRQIYGE